MKILYLEGDPNSPKYIEGALRHLAHRPQTRVTNKDVGRVEGFDLYLLSDAAAKDVGRARMDQIARAVEQGASLIVAGGWTSLGRGGYAGTRLGDLLPVGLHDGDDRVNVPSGLLLRPTDKGFWRGLSFRPPPVITGYNRVRPRKGANVALTARRIRGVDQQVARLDSREIPILVLEERGPSRIAVLATDPAPHWSGGWTDWGERAIDVGNKEELGDHYVEFWRRLIDWSSGPPARRA